MSVIFTKENNIYTITWDRPVSNALNMELIRGFGEVIKSLEKEPLGIVLLSSALKNVFSSGLDLNELCRADLGVISRNLYDAVYEIFQINQTIVKSKHIFCALLNGAVIGSAVSIAAACDLRIASDKTWFWLPDPQYGGLLADGGTDILAYKCAAFISSNLLMTNYRINAENLYSWGLLTEVYKSERFYDLALKRVKTMEEYSLTTLSSTKKMLNKNLKMTFDEEVLKKVFKSRELAAKMKKFMERSI